MTLGGMMGFGVMEHMKERQGAVQTPLRTTRKARFLRAEVIDGADLASFQTALTAWFTAADEEEFVDLYPLAEYSCIILYME